MKLELIMPISAGLREDIVVYGGFIGQQYKKINYIALREITLSYNVPTKISSYIGAKNLSLSFTGRNLAYLLNTAPNHENPESVRGTGAAQFRMRSFMPYTASYLFTLNATF